VTQADLLLQLQLHDTAVSEVCKHVKHSFIKECVWLSLLLLIGHQHLSI